MTYTEFTEETLPTSPSMYGLTQTANGDRSSHSTMWRNPQGLLHSHPCYLHADQEGILGPPQALGRNLVLLSCLEQDGCGGIHV